MSFPGGYDTNVGDRGGQAFGPHGVKNVGYFSYGLPSSWCLPQPQTRKGSSLLKIRCPLCGSVTSGSRASKGVPGTRKCKNVVPLDQEV